MPTVQTKPAAPPLGPASAAVAAAAATYPEPADTPLPPAPGDSDGWRPTREEWEQMRAVVELVGPTLPLLRPLADFVDALTAVLEERLYGDDLDLDLDQEGTERR